MSCFPKKLPSIGFPCSLSDFLIWTADSFPLALLRQDKTTAALVRLRSNPERVLILCDLDEKVAQSAAQLFLGKQFPNVAILTGGQLPRPQATLRHPPHTFVGVYHQSLLFGHFFFLRRFGCVRRKISRPVDWSTSSPCCPCCFDPHQAPSAAHRLRPRLPLLHLLPTLSRRLAVPQPLLARRLARRPLRRRVARSLCGRLVRAGAG